MDRFYYYEKHHQEHQRNLENQLATRRLFDFSSSESLSGYRMKKLVLRGAPAMIVFTLLLLYFIH
jgi:hypothetical protein